MATTTSQNVNGEIIPTSPPPSYEHVLEETRMAASNSYTDNSNDNNATSNDNVSEDRRNNQECYDNTCQDCGGQTGGGGSQDHDENEENNRQDSDEEDERQEYQEQSSPQQGPITLHKSSKELYKAVAKQFGITCKMSDGCRCFDCQSHYFECEYEENEQEKTDGGLGAGTPMFISEVMHGSACNIL